MKGKRFRFWSAIMAAFLILGSTQAAFASCMPETGGEEVSAAEVQACDDDRSLFTQTGIADGYENAQAAPAESSETDGTDRQAGDQGQYGAVTVQSVEYEELTEEDLAVDNIVYGIDQYENDQVLVLTREGSLELLQYDSTEALAIGLEELENDPGVDSFQPNFTYENTASTLAISNDPYVSSQWALSNKGTFRGYRNSLKSVAGIDVGADRAWSLYKANRDVTIALVDTGVETSHPELKGSFWTNPGEISGNGRDDDGNGYVDDVSGWNFYDNNNVIYSGTSDNHGTHCAGTITAATNNEKGTAGLADYDNIKVMPVKALGGSAGSGTTLSVALAIKYAEANGASVCNLSLGTDTDDRMLYKAMKNSGMLFVVAAGNGGENGVGVNIDKKPNYPGSYTLENMIVVGNIAADGSLHQSSDYGSVSVDIAAPGTDIIGLIANGRYSYMTGTSMSAPFVSAAAAMVYSAAPDLSISDVRNIILNTAKKNDALKGKIATGGMLDCGAALAYAVTGSADTGTDTGGADTGGQTGDGQADSQTGTVIPAPVQTPAGQPSGGLVTDSPSYDTGFGAGRLLGWYGWHFRMDIPQIFRIVLKMSGSID